MATKSIKAEYSGLDDVYASLELSTSSPKTKFPNEERNPPTVFAAVRDELILDGNSHQNLATFCQTWVDVKIRQLIDLSIDKNMFDKVEYPQAAEIESPCVHMIADLWNSPDAENTLGCTMKVSTEATMLGGLALKWQWRKKRDALEKDTAKPNLICGPVQIYRHKFTHYFEVELRKIPLEGDR